MSSVCSNIIPEQLVFQSNSFKLSDVPIIMCGDLVTNLKGLIALYGCNDCTLILICDNVLHDIIGIDLGKSLACEIVVLGERPQRTVQLAQEIAQKCRLYDHIFILGGGTVVDIGKHAATLADKPFSILPSAPSSISYSSTHATLYNNNTVEFLYTNTPSAIYVDVNLISKAPIELIIGGLSECLAFYVSEVDWLISHVVFDKKYNADIYNFLLRYLNKVFPIIKQIVLRNKSALTVLMECLLVSGLLMHASSFSYLFQGVYNILHSLESMYGFSLKTYDSSKYIITNTSVMYKLQKYLLSKPPIMYDTPVNFNDISINVAEQLKKKNAIDFREVNYKIATSWEKINNRMDVMPDITKLYKDMSLDFSYQDLFISKNSYIKSVQLAPFMVDSFGSLDVAMYTNPKLINKFVYNAIL